MLSPGMSRPAICSYYEFCADETTRKWQWENRTRRETAFWNAVGLWLGGEWHLKFLSVQRGLNPQSRCKLSKTLLCRVLLHGSLHGPDSCQLGLHHHHPTDLQPYHL